MRTVILAGWGTGHALAAAVTLQKYPNAEVIGVSKKRLPDKVKKLAEGDERGPISRLIILGIPLHVDSQVLYQGLKKLHDQGCACTWYSVYPPGSEERKLQPVLAMEVAEQTQPLSRYMAQKLNLDKRIKPVKTLLQTVEHQRQGTVSDIEQQMLDLVEAATSRYRRFQEPEHYQRAIHTIAKGEGLSDEQRRIIQEYQRFGSREFRGRSKATGRIHYFINTVGPENQCNVLITGETGVGKETVAYLLHGKSDRAGEAFIPFNCADLNPHLVESRLFGHVTGAFTGATHRRRGAFEQADGGTLFLDEIAELSDAVQAGILRVLQEKRFYPLGAEEEKEVDVRIVAATNQDLTQRISKGGFRSDLFYRLNTVPLHVPPLRERPEDIRIIADDILYKQGRPCLNDEQAMQLQSYTWPGNVRELNSVLERARIFNISDYIQLISENEQKALPAGEQLDDVIREHCRRIYDRYGHNKTRAAKALDVSVNTLKKYLE